MNYFQLPYTIFGLGLAPNFLDYMTVNVTNATDSSRGHTWSQVRLLKYKVDPFFMVINFSALWDDPFLPHLCLTIPR